MTNQRRLICRISDCMYSRVGPRMDLGEGITGYLERELCSLLYGSVHTHNYGDNEEDKTVFTALC